MKELDSVALELVNKALGLAGAGAQTTELEDGLLQQVLEVSGLIGRGRSPIGDAIAWAVLQTTHGGADTQVVAVDPYFTTSSPGITYNWPVPVPAGFDIWLIGATGRNLGLLTASALASGYVGLVGDVQGDAAWAQRESGGAPGAVFPIRYPLVSWTGEATLGGQAFFVGDDNDAAARNDPVRIRRGSTIECRLTSTGTAVYQVAILLGLFPVGLGQDAAT
jgi:hypothetical protein